LLLAIYSYFTQTEREFISIHSKQGLAAAKAQGKQLGRPKGSQNQGRPLEPYRAQIATYLQAGLTIAAVQKLINPHLEVPLTYNSYKYFIQNDKKLRGHLKA
jgi:DNA invertase Pin-like site-specific DNA recombinase